MKNLVLLSFSIGIFILFSFSPPKKRNFFSGIGVCTNFSQSELLISAGYDYIEEGVGHLLAPLQSEEHFDSVLNEMKKEKLPVLACNGFIPGNLKSVGPDADHPSILKYAETAFRRARLAGVKFIVFGSGASRGIPDGFDRAEARKQFISLCSQMAPLAVKYGVVVVLEPLNSKECNFINSVAEGGKIVEEVNHPGFRLLADIYHMLMENEGPENLLKYGHLIHHTHIAEKEGRAAPGTHKEDFRPYFKALKKAGYRGGLSIECRWENMNLQAASSLQYLKTQL